MAAKAKGGLAWLHDIAITESTAGPGLGLGRALQTVAQPPEGRTNERRAGRNTPGPLLRLVWRGCARFWRVMGRSFAPCPGAREKRQPPKQNHSSAPNLRAVRGEKLQLERGGKGGRLVCAASLVCGNCRLHRVQGIATSCNHVAQDICMGCYIMCCKYWLWFLSGRAGRELVVPLLSPERKKVTSDTRNLLISWSERLDSNQRPPAPKAGALPGCATFRKAEGTDRRKAPC